jgi:hypothetical protein
MITTNGFKYETVTFRHAKHPAITVYSKDGVVEITVDALAAVLKELGYELEVIDD